MWKALRAADGGAPPWHGATWTARMRSVVSEIRCQTEAPNPIVAARPHSAAAFGRIRKQVLVVVLQRPVLGSGAASGLDPNCGAASGFAPNWSAERIAATFGRQRRRAPRFRLHGPFGCLANAPFAKWSPRRSFSSISSLVDGGTGGSLTRGGVHCHGDSAAYAHAACSGPMLRTSCHAQARLLSTAAKYPHQPEAAPLAPRGALGTKPGVGFVRGPGRACNFEDTRAPPPEPPCPARAWRRRRGRSCKFRTLIHEPPTPSPVLPAWLVWGASCQPE
jgi:hypothetical protein